MPNPRVPEASRKYHRRCPTTLAPTLKIRHPKRNDGKNYVLANQATPEEIQPPVTKTVDTINLSECEKLVRVLSSALRHRNSGWRHPPPRPRLDVPSRTRPLRPTPFDNLRVLLPDEPGPRAKLHPSREIDRLGGQETRSHVEELPRPGYDYLTRCIESFISSGSF